MPRWLRWVVIALLVIGLVVLAAARVRSAVGAQAPGDPRSAAPAGASAVSALLSDQGVQVERADTAGDAVDLVTEDDQPATLVIVHPERLGAGDIAAIRTSGAARLVLVQPDQTALRNFDTRVQLGGLPPSFTLPPQCTDPLALRAGAIVADPDGHSLLPPTPTTGCFPDSAGGVRYLRVGSTGAGQPGPQIDLVADGFANERLATEGNAAFATGLLGSQPRLVWLMTPRPAVTEPSGPGLLPDWWLVLLTQVGLGVLVLAVWRGRRLGPIMVEPLPVVVRASETVEGHGRLYQRIQARDQAAAALRAATQSRLASRFGHAGDPAQLAAALAVRTGNDPARIQRLLAGPAPQTDPELNQLARDLDQLEQEARQL